MKNLAPNSAKKLKQISTDVIAALIAHSWPGNVRELENIIERSMIVSSGPDLRLDGLPYFAEVNRIASAAVEHTTIRPLEEIERDYIRAVCVRCNWKIHGKGNAADKLHINPNTLRSRMRKLGIKRPV